MARGVSMLLIDEKGNRVRTICRECRQLHTAKDCPRPKRAFDPCIAATREFARWADAYRAGRRRA
jgi:hypothetical protein